MNYDLFYIIYLNRTERGVDTACIPIPTCTFRFNLFLSFVCKLTSYALHVLWYVTVQCILLLIPYLMRGINFCITSHKAHFTNFEISHFFFRQFETIQNYNRKKIIEFAISYFCNLAQINEIAEISTRLN